jgi:peptidyl-prolyl cis-trans isomerase C
MRIGTLVSCILLSGLSVAGQVNAADAATDTLVSNSRVAVSRADFDAELLERVPSDDRFEFLASRERIGRMLAEILTRKTLADEARKAGLDKSPQITVKMALAQERVLATERVNHLDQEVKLPDFEPRAKEIYKLNPERFTEKHTVRASHILIGLQGRSKEEALKLAKEVHAQAVSGKDFAELVTKYSDDPGSKDKKGDLGYFAAEAMVKPFSNAAFAMKKGEISAPVESEFGFHIIQVVDTKPGGKQPYDTVRPAIIEELKTQYVADFKANHVGQIRADKDMKVNEEEIQKIKTVLPHSTNKK